MGKIKTKVCTKCKIEKPFSEFYKGRDKYGLQYKCKECKRQYDKDNALRIAEYYKKYNNNYFMQIRKQKKHYRKNNILQISKQRKQHYKDNTPRLLKQKKQYGKDSAMFKTYFKQIEQFEEIRRCSEKQELLEVKCAYCGRWIIPNNLQVKNRIGVFNGTQPGEQRFYCSENCKQSCPIFNQVLWPKGFKKATSREVVPLLRQLVLERDNYTCQKCWATTETAQLHVHHEKSYTLSKIMANDPDNCITFCRECHKWAHSQDGCKYVDLQCPKDNKNE